MSTAPPAQAYAAALAGFSLMNVHRLGALLRHHPPEHAFAIASGHAPADGLIGRVLAKPDVRDTWRTCATTHSPERVWQRCHDLGVRVIVYGDPDYPTILLDDPLPPPVLFALGDLAVLEGRRVAIVGTRNATAAGRDVATRLGHGLGASGVHVVSGLARGIDGCAHRGLLGAQGAGRALGVVASGLDVVYPREHLQLWRQVAEHGLLLSEAPPGTSPEAHRFPLRNRIIAAMSELVVVVESREKGGSLITVNEAADRGVPIMAVPGGLHNRSATGSNNLLREGAGAVIDASDVLIALSMDHRRSGPAASDQRARPRRDDIPVYEACAGEPRTIDSIVLAVDVSLAEAAMSLARLEQAGWLGQADGWFEAVGAPLR